MAFNLRWSWILGVIAISAAARADRIPIIATPTAATRAVVIAELFTSEGCSSCPPADEVLSQLARQSPTEEADVLTIGEHVDYWDRLGWRDRFSSPQFSARQSAYDANVFHRNEIYTPQIVIDGRLARVGSDVEAIRRDIRSAAQEQKATVAVTLLAVFGRVLHVDIHASLPDAYVPKGAVDIVVVATEDGLATDVRAGENRGRTLRHDAVARWMRSVATFPGAERTWGTQTDITMATDWKLSTVKVIAFLQERKSRRIIGAGVTRVQS